MSNDNSVNARPSVNPYESSGIADINETPELTDKATEPFRFQLRMDWSDRRRFLKAVGPLRAAAIAGAMLGAVGLYGFFLVVFATVQLTAFGDPLDLLRLGHTMFSLLRGALALYLAWLYWKLADALAATAGGRTYNMHQWSSLQLRIARLILLTVALGIVWLAWEWIEGQIALRRLLPG